MIAVQKAINRDGHCAQQAGARAANHFQTVVNRLDLGNTSEISLIAALKIWFNCGRVVETSRFRWPGPSREMWGPQIGIKGCEIARLFYEGA
jgi:hypothetical protein